MKEISVTNESAGQRLDKYLKRLLPSCPGNLLYKQLRNKNITLNGSKANGSELISEGDLIRIFFSDATFDKFSHGEITDTSRYTGAYKKTGNIDVIYSDKDIIIFNKPAGLLSQPDSGSGLSVNDHLIGYLLEKGEITEESLSSFRPSVCNRLDRNTSGIILCSKSYRGARFLNRIISDRDIEKYYLALVKGKFDAEGIHTSFVIKDEKENKLLFKDSSYEGAVEIKSGFEIIKAGDDASLLMVRLYTGKSHQIRAHLAHLGFHIIGDPKYGSGNEYGARRQMLHAYYVKVDDKESGYVNTVWKAPVPADMRAVMETIFGKEDLPI